MVVDMADKQELSFLSFLSRYLLKQGINNTLENREITLTNTSLKRIIDTKMNYIKNPNMNEDDTAIKVISTVLFDQNGDIDIKLTKDYGFKGTGSYVLEAVVKNRLLNFNEPTWDDVIAKLVQDTQVDNLIVNMITVLDGMILTLRGNNILVVGTLVAMLEKARNIENSQVNETFNAQFDNDFSQLQGEQTMQTLKQQIDEALDNGDEAKFYELTERYNQLRQARRRSRRSREKQGSKILRSKTAELAEIKYITPYVDFHIDNGGLIFGVGKDESGVFINVQASHFGNQTNDIQLYVDKHGLELLSVMFSKASKQELGKVADVAAEASMEPGDEI